MNSAMRSNICVPIAAMLLSADLAATAVAQTQVPFKGGLQGNDSDSDATATSVVVTTVGTGNGTLLGHFSFTQVATVDFESGTDTGSAQWTAANGDSICT